MALRRGFTAFFGPTPSHRLLFRSLSTGRIRISTRSWLIICSKLNKEGLR